MQSRTDQDTEVSKPANYKQHQPVEYSRTLQLPSGGARMDGNVVGSNSKQGTARALGAAQFDFMKGKA